MSPEVICISSSPAQIFARSPTSVAYDSPPSREILPVISSPPPSSAASPLPRKTSIPRSRRPQQSENITQAGRRRDSVSINGSILSAGIGRENIPLSGDRSEAAGGTREAEPSSKPKPRKRATKATTKDSTQSGPGGKTSRSQKSKIVDKLSNGTLSGKVSKPRAGPAPEVPEKTARKTRSPTPDRSIEGINESFRWESGCLELDEATSRKNQWTPPRNSPTPVLNLTNDDDDALSDTRSSSSLTNKGFGGLFSNFGFNKPSQVPRDNCLQGSGGGPTKKRRLELVDNKSTSTSLLQMPSVGDRTNNEENSNLVDKPKRVQKRKLTTITAHATAGYRDENKEKETAPHKQFFPIQGNKEEDIEKKRGYKKRSSKARQSRKEHHQKNKHSSPSVEILPPEQAFKTFADQELLFGTLSQLERDESPTLTRDTQIALEKSVDCTPAPSFEDSEPNQRNISSYTSSSRAGSVTSRLAGSRKLWSVAARDLEGSLAKADVIDLIDTPKAAQVVAEIKPPQDSNEEWLDIDAVPDTPSRDNNNVSDQENAYISGDADTASLKPTDEKDNQSTSMPDATAEDTTLPQKPVFGGYSTAELSKQIASYGFKPIKSREAMITLLEKCWESKNKYASSTSRNNRQPPSLGPEGAKSGIEKPLPLPKPKPGHANLDSANNITAQEKRKVTAGKRAKQTEPSVASRNIGTSGSSKSSTTSAKVPAPDVPSFSSAALTSRPGPRSSAKTSASASKNRKSLPDLSLQVKSAIQSQPPISSQLSEKQLTWHEKILMYDPIVLEDLATWLNTEGLGQIGEDREVSAGFVREWCEKEGVCCCWKKGLDMPGGSRGAWR